MALKDSNFIILKDTDTQWKKFGKSIPYFGVLSNQKYKKKTLSEDDFIEFFKSGEEEMRDIYRYIKKHIKPDFSPKSSLDFGCGVGRLVIPISKISTRVCGVDVSEEMINEARRNCDRYSVKNATLFLSDDTVFCLHEKFDFINTSKVLQHIPEERGQKIFARMLELLDVGGVGVFDFCYYGAPRHSLINQIKMKLNIYLKNEPLMLMHNYNLNEIFHQIQESGITDMHVLMSDKGHKHLGIRIFLAK
ncbi:MAG: hypothetical protein A2176_08820 [Spirochaetes bacterium RBG_13_51_14]|nr:MAG: hypothetical protein A2176_08820 [Spirochaetes bacterium RBG_13_51_14]